MTEPERTEDGHEDLAGLPPSRIQALADGIFAVAMTILVLELHIPTPAPGELTEAALVRVLLTLGPKALSYVVGFVILGSLWVGHHYQFHYIRRSDRALLWINLLLLLAITFLPFVVALVGTYGASRVSCGLYGATLLVPGACLLVQWQYAAGAKRRLVSRSLDVAIIVAVRNRVRAGVIGYAVGSLLALVEPRLSLLCFGIVPVFYLLPGRVDRHLQGR